MCELLTGAVVDIYFDIMQIVNVQQQVGFDFEGACGKVDGLDMDGDGLLDRYPEGHEKAGEVILQSLYGPAEVTPLLPDWAFDLDYSLDWWKIGGDLVNSEGKKLVGANPDGTYILEE